MSHQEILEKAIQKAIEGGWQHYSFGGHAQNLLDEIADADIHKCVGNSVYGVIFNHDFAKALWGEEVHDASTDVYEPNLFPCEHCGVIGDMSVDFCWQSHLQQMVIADDPIEYLGANI